MTESMRFIYLLLRVERISYMRSALKFSRLHLFFSRPIQGTSKIEQSPLMDCRLTLRKSVLERVSYGPASFPRAGKRQFFEVPFRCFLIL